MSPWTSLLALALLLLLSGVFSGSETGVYSLSRVRLEAEAHAGRPMARLLARLLRNDTGLLITLLIGNNLMLELMTHVAESRVASWGGVPPWGKELLITACLTPVVFFFGELLPKDVFRRRPHRLLGGLAWLLAIARVAFFPIALPLRWLSASLERMLGAGEGGFTRVLAREEVVEFLTQAAREGALEAHAEALAHNVLVMRQTAVSRVMVPWAQVEHVDLDRPASEVMAALQTAEHSRLPAGETREGRWEVVGYVHQLDALAAPDAPPAEELRRIPSLPPELSVDRALARMQVSGQRVALVGPPEAPLGLVALMDLVAAISGDAAA